MKKIIGVVLVFCMSLGILSGCAQKTKKVNNKKEFEVSKMIKDTDDYSLKVLNITKKGINFEFKNKTDKEVDLDLDISLDGIMESLYNFDTSDIKAHSKNTYLFEGKLTQCEYEKMTIHITLFANSRSFVNDSVVDFDLGGSITNNRKIKNGTTLYKSPDLIINYLGTTETGIKLKVVNKLKKDIWIDFEDFYYNDNIKAPYIGVETLNAKSIKEVEIKLNSSENNFYASELKQFTCRGCSVLNNLEKERFELKYLR